MPSFSDTVDAIFKAQTCADDKKATKAQVEEVLRSLADTVATIKKDDVIRLIKHGGKSVGKFYMGTLAARKGTAAGKAWSKPERKVLKFKRNPTNK